MTSHLGSLANRIVNKVGLYRNRIPVICVLTAIICLTLGCSLSTPDYTIKNYVDTRLFPKESIEHKRPEHFVSHANNAMVASESRQASQIGVNILKKGGNAVDAAIAVSFAISVYRPHSTGIGGGGFFLLHQKEQDDFVFLDMREKAPLKASRDMFLRSSDSNFPLSQVGALSIAVPGLVSGLYQAYQKYGSGKFSWSELIEPSIELAENGFEVYPRLAEAIAWFEKRGYMKRFSGARKLLTSKSGKPLTLGQTYRNPDLAHSLRLISEHGPQAFYRGALAKKLLSGIKAAGGIVSQKDFNVYTPTYRTTVRGKYRGFEIVSAPPPSSGGALVVQMLNMFEAYDLKKLGFNNPKSLHLKSEVMRRAFADRSKYFGDPDFWSVPLKGLTSKEYALELASSIDLQQASNSSGQVKPGSPKAYESPSTTHFSIVDADGNAVSSTQSINYFFGSGVVPAGTGIFLNNTMDDFSTEPGVANVFGLVGAEANAVAPGKVPLSSMTPTMVTKEGKLFLILGSPGGPKIISAVLNVILNVIDHDMPLSDAVFAPRVHHQWLPDKVVLDKVGFDKHTIADLSGRGHLVEESAYGIGNVTAVMVDDGSLIGVTDPRREGSPVGY